MNYIYNFNEYSLIKHRKLIKGISNDSYGQWIGLIHIMILHLISDAKLMAIKFKRTIN